MVHTERARPKRLLINAPTVSRVHREAGKPSWSGEWVSISATMADSCAPLSLGAGGRPWGLWSSAASPPWRYWLIHRATVPRATPKVRAAAVWFIPPRMARTARLLRTSCPSGERERASFTCTTQHLLQIFRVHYGWARLVCHLFSARSNKWLCKEAKLLLTRFSVFMSRSGWHFIQL